MLSTLNMGGRGGCQVTARLVTPCVSHLTGSIYDVHCVHGWYKLCQLMKLCFCWMGLICVWSGLICVGLDWASVAEIMSKDTVRTNANKAPQCTLISWIVCLCVCLCLFVMSWSFQKRRRGERREREARRKGGRRGGEESREQEKSREGVAEMRHGEEERRRGEKERAPG
jgi:hypothetical protein